MNSEILEDILSKANQQLVRKRKVVLFLDNISPHSPELADKFSNIKITFVLKNTTSCLTLLDAGIIKTFKVHY